MKCPPVIIIENIITIKKKKFNRNTRQFSSETFFYELLIGKRTHTRFVFKQKMQPETRTNDSTTSNRDRKLYWERQRNGEKKIHTGK